jgi:anti-anti-sigma factor
VNASLGKILVADHDGTFVIKLVGDVRVTMCVAFDEYLAKMLVPGKFHSVIIDLSETHGIDSTTLGLLAKVAIQSARQFNYRPMIISTNESITRLIESMGFDAVFDICTEPLRIEKSLRALQIVNCTEDTVRDKVIEAHRQLMDLNDENRSKFSELVTSLESATG